MGSNRSIKRSTTQCTSKDKFFVKEVDLKVNDEGHDEDFRGLKSNLESFQCVCVGLICV